MVHFISHWQLFWAKTFPLLTFKHLFKVRWIPAEFQKELCVYRYIEIFQIFQLLTTFQKCIHAYFLRNVISAAVWLGYGFRASANTAAILVILSPIIFLLHCFFMEYKQHCWIRSNNVKWILKEEGFFVLMTVDPGARKGDVIEFTYIADKERVDHFLTWRLRLRLGTPWAE